MFLPVMGCTTNNGLSKLNTSFSDTNDGSLFAGCSNSLMAVVMGANTLPGVKPQEFAENNNSTGLLCLLCRSS
jgi:hypothetical protein